MYKRQGKKGLFDEEFTKERLSVMGNPLDSVLKSQLCSVNNSM